MGNSSGWQTMTDTMRSEKESRPLAPTEIETTDKGEGEPKVFRQKTFPMGRPQASLDKAWTIAAALEDAENLRKMSLRK